MSTTETAPELEIDNSLPPQESHDSANSVVHAGKEHKRSSFSSSLDKRINKEEKVPEAGKTSESPASIGDNNPDPIAEKAAAEKKAPKPEERPKSAEQKEESSEEPKLERKSLKNLLEDKPKTKADEKASDDKKEAKADVSDAEIEEELKNPHKSEKAQKRFMELHRRWKEADAKAATTAKQIAEKDAKLAELEKKIAEAGKAAGVPPEVQAQLDELAQYRRQYEVEKSPEYTKFDVKHKEEEQEIASILSTAGIKFQGMTQEQTLAFIAAEGGYDAFQRKHPKVASQLRDFIAEHNPALNDDITSAISRQKLLKKAQQAYLDGEKASAKEYFSKIEADRKAKEEEAAKAPKPEEINAKRRQAMDAWRDDAFTKLDFFKDEEVPADASEATCKAIKEKNEFAASLRATLSENLSIKSDEDLKDVALAATLAHKIKRERDDLATKVEQLEAELKKVKSAGRTVTKSTQPAAVATAEKPAKSFSEALDRAQSRRE